MYIRIYSSGKDGGTGKDDTFNLNFQLLQKHHMYECSVYEFHKFGLTILIINEMVRR